MLFLEVISNDDDIEKQYVNINSIRNVICTEGRIIVYNDDGFKGKAIKKYTTSAERDAALEELNTVLGFKRL